MKRLVVLAVVITPTIGIAAEIGGTWQGEYTCNQGRTGLTLTVTPSKVGAAQAVFRFYQIEATLGFQTAALR